MIEVVGKYNKAIIYATMVDPTSYGQILHMCNLEMLKDSRIRMMPDTHAALNCTVGTTLSFNEYVNPSFVGDDIGCGMQVYKLEEENIDFQALDNTIRAMIKSGASINERANPKIKMIDLKKLHCYDYIRHDTARRAFGTLGGGNHFIEIDRAPDGKLYLLIHSGSRRLGKDVASYYKKVAYFMSCEADPIMAIKKNIRPGSLKSNAQFGECFLSGQMLDYYLDDMKTAVDYASESRKAMGEEIISSMNLHPTQSFTTIHNYIDKDTKILRKGSVSAAKNEIFIIPINMKDGSLICKGKGNPEWNYSAPHGSGRVMKRSDAKAELSLDEYKLEMEGVYSTSVNSSTIDESPMAYRRINEITDVIDPTAEVIERLISVYNFKASVFSGDEELMDGDD